MHHPQNWNTTFGTTGKHAHHKTANATARAKSRKGFRDPDFPVIGTDFQNLLKGKANDELLARAATEYKKVMEMPANTS